MRILYDSKNPKFKQPFGCIKQDEECTLNLYIPSSCMTTNVSVEFDTDSGRFASFPMNMTSTDSGYDIYTGTFTLSETDLYFYYFRITTHDGAFDLFKHGEHDTNISAGDKWQLTCYPKDGYAENDFAGKVMYQIFPDRFFRENEPMPEEKLQPFYVHTDVHDCPDYRPNSEGKILNNDFFGGNLRGIEQKIDYLKSLGVSVIYLNPIFMAFSNHRYDTCNYMKIDPLLGTEEDFVSLCNAAHDSDIRIILDGVFSHTGSDSIYFDKENIFGGGAYNDAESPYRKWYRFNDSPVGYESWWGIETLPCVNEMCPEYLEYIITGDDSVVRHWLRLGADGFRLDVADELPDAFIKILHDTVHKEKPNSIVIGEVWEDASNKTAYDIRRKYFSDAELDSVMNYPFMQAIIALAREQTSAADFAAAVMTIAENYPEPVLHRLMNSLSTHDTARVMTVLSGADMGMARDAKAHYVMTDDETKRAHTRLMLCIMLQFVLPGCPCIYYGDEIGMEGFEDPFNRRYFDWDKDGGAISAFVRQMSGLKNSSEVLRRGSVSVTAKDAVLTVERKLNGETVRAVVNTGDMPYTVTAKNPLALHLATTAGDYVVLQKQGFVLI